MDDQLARGVTNSLWPHLRADRWQRHTCTRDLGKWNPPGYRTGPRTATVPTTPAASTTVIQHAEAWIAALLLAEEWPGITCATCHGSGHTSEPTPTNGLGAWYEVNSIPCGACRGTGVIRASYAVRLTREAHDLTLAALPPDTRYAYLACLHSTARAPFVMQPNRHGRDRLRRDAYDPLLSAVAAAALVGVARAAELVLVSEDSVDDYLVGGA